MSRGIPIISVVISLSVVAATRVDDDVDEVDDVDGGGDICSLRLCAFDYRQSIELEYLLSKEIKKISMLVL